MIQPKQHKTLFLWLSIFLGVFTTLITYQIGNNDHIEQLPILNRYLDATYLLNDFFTNSNAVFSPRYYYTGFIGYLSSWFGIPWVFLIGTLLSNVAVSILTYLTGLELFKNTSSGIIASALVMALPTISLGSDLVLYASMFTPTTLVFPLILLSFYLFLKGRLLLSILVTGCISIFHVLIGLEYGVLWLSTAIILDYLKNRDMISVLKKMSLFLVIGIFLLPNLIPHFQNTSSIKDSLFIEILANFRHPHHYVLSDILTLKEGVNLFLMMTLSIFVYLGIKRNSLHVRQVKIFKLLAILLVVSVGLSWVFVEIIPLKLITTLQLLRLLMIEKWIFLIFLGHFIVLGISKSRADLKMIIVSVILGLLVFLSDISFFKVVFIAGLYTVILFLAHKQYRRLLIPILGVVTLLIIALNTLDIPEIKKYQRSYTSANYMTSSQSTLVDFIQSKTSESSIFLAPHLFGFVRTEAKRALVVDYKAFPFQEQAMKEWYSRIEDCYGLEKEAFEATYKKIEDQKLQELHKKYAFDYAILDVETQTKIPVIYSNSEFKIIDLANHAQ